MAIWFFNLEINACNCPTSLTGGNDKESCISSIYSGFCVEGRGGMRFARLQPSALVIGSTNLYVAFLTTWLRATTSTSILVSSD